MYNSGSMEGISKEIMATERISQMFPSISRGFRLMFVHSAETF
jgi:hypothetical protein